MKSALRISSVIAGFFLFAAHSITAQIQPVYQPQPTYQPQPSQPAYQNQRGTSERGTALNRGNFSIGSGLGYVNSVTNIQIDNGNTVVKSGNTNFSIHLTPSIGYFFARNFVFGLGMDYIVSSSRDNTDNTNGVKETSDDKLLFGPFTRIYLPFGGDQAFFLGAVYGYGRSQTEITAPNNGGSQVVNTTLSTFGAGPGYSIFANRRAALEVQAKYNYGYSRNSILVDGATQSTRTLTTAWDFVVGIHFYFNNRGARTSSVN